MTATNAVEPKYMKVHAQYAKLHIYLFDKFTTKPKSKISSIISKIKHFLVHTTLVTTENRPITRMTTVKQSWNNM